MTSSAVAAPAQKEFTVVLRGPSAAVFEEDAGIRLREANAGDGHIQLHFRTRWRVLGEGRKLPGHVWLEAVGCAASLDEAVSKFSRSALVFVPVISFAANAAIGDCDFELAFDSSSSRGERDFIQSYVPDEVALLREGRRIDPPATVKLLEAIQRSSHRERVLRAVNQYWLALQSWRFGYESMAVAHLWMAVEALTKAVLREERRRRGLASQSELAAALGVELKGLDATIRRNLILQGDDECYGDGKEASDGLEHGFLGFDEIRGKSAKVRDRMGTLVRRAIFGLVNLEPEATTVLERAPFDKPLGNWPLTRLMRGQLIGEGVELAAPGNAYPVLAWKVSLNKAEPTSGGRVKAEMTEAMTPQLGPGIAFKPLRHEVWGQ